MHLSYAPSNLQFYACGEQARIHMYSFLASNSHRTVTSRFHCVDIFDFVAGHDNTRTHADHVDFFSYMIVLLVFQVCVVDICFSIMDVSVVVIRTNQATMSMHLFGFAFRWLELL